MEDLYKFMVSRYLGNVVVRVFGEIDKKTFELKTNLTITTNY